MSITADEVLTVLNDMEPFDLTALEIAVVTHGSAERWNVASQRMVKVDKPNFWPFEQGEVVLLGEHGREPFGERRKPSKWDVRTETFATLAEAKVRSAAIKAGPAKFTTELFGEVQS